MARRYSNKITLRPAPGDVSIPVGPIDLILVDADPNGNIDGAAGDVAYLAGGIDQWRCIGGTAWVLVSGSTSAAGTTPHIPDGGALVQTAFDDLVLAEATALGCTYTLLPTASAPNRNTGVTVKHVGLAGIVVTVLPSGADLIDGMASVMFTIPNTSITFRPDQSVANSWWIK